MAYKIPKSYAVLWSFCLLLVITATPSTAQIKPALPTADTSKTVPDTLLFKIQKAQSAITEINSNNQQGYGIARIRKSITAIKTNIEPVKAYLETDKKGIDTKSLLSYNLILTDALTKLETLQSTLVKSNSDLQHKSQEVIEISKDSLLNVTATDTTSRKLYRQQLNELKLQLQETGLKTTANLDTLSRLLADVSAYYGTVSDLKNSTLDRIMKSGQSDFSKESPYIWAAPKANLNNNSIGDLLESSFAGQNKILTYFFNSTWDNRILQLLIGIFFFFWVRSNFKKSKTPAIQQKLGELNFRHILPYPFITSFIFLLNLTPLFEPNSPSLYIEINQFLLLMVLILHYWKHSRNTEVKHLRSGMLLYIIILVTNAVVQDEIWVRLWLIVLNIGSFYLGYKFYKKATFTKRFTRFVLIIYITFNLLSVLLNVFGRITLAKTFSTTAIIGLTQVIGLAVFIQIVTEALELQIKISSCSGGLFSRVSLSKTRMALKKMLSVFTVILWLLVFMINLNISGGIFALLEQVLVKPRTFGSVNFTLGNLLFFGFIIYFANLLQKHLDVLFGDGNLRFEDQTHHKGSKIALLRLVIIVIGVLLAVTASGVPLDKLTVVLGALSVGVGLGMQNIVNNFVSGIILIFEKPFRIGDYVELADKKGKVQDIGIRSSRLLTPQGSEVIIPNGDLLSGRLVNWTLSNDYLKTEIVFKVDSESDMDVITRIIQDEVEKANDSIKNLPPEILVNAIAADNMELKIIVWITSIYIEASFKSNLLKQLLVQFKDKGIRIV